MATNTNDMMPPQGNDKATDAKVIQFLNALDSESEMAKKEYQQRWEENIRQVRGDQWRLKRSPYFLANIIKNQVRRKVATLTESKPQIQVKSRKANMSRASNILYNAAKSLFEKNNTEETIYRLAQFGMTMGSAFIGIFYNKAIDDIELTFIDPRRVFLDPMVTAAADLDKAQYLRIDSVLPLAEVRMNFPGRGALVEPTSKPGTYGNQNPRSRWSVVSATLSVMPRIYRPGNPPKAGPIPRVEIKEYWIRDPQLNMVGDPLFPRGRHIVRAGGIILLDEPNPYIDGGWPLEMFEWDVDYETPWGLDEVSDLRRLQEAINRMGDSWIQNTLLSANFKIIADLDALDSDQWDKLDNEAGLVIRKRPNRTLEYQPPTPPSVETPMHIQNLIQLCDLLTGNMDAQGNSPASGSAALEGLQMARQTLIRSVARRMEATLERVGQKLISRIFQFYTSDRILFQQGATRDWISYTYERLKLLEDDEGNARPAEEITSMYRDFKFMVAPLSSLAITRIQRTMASLQLRAATGVAPSVRRILQEADMGDPDELLREGLEELSKLPPPPPPKGRAGKK